jgi:hypothetical protein
MEIETSVSVDIESLGNDVIAYLAQSALNLLDEGKSQQVIENNLDKATDEALIEELQKRNYEIKEQ